MSSTPNLPDNGLLPKIEATLSTDGKDTVPIGQVDQWMIENLSTSDGDLYYLGDTGDVDTEASRYSLGPGESSPFYVSNDRSVQVKREAGLSVTYRIHRLGLKGQE